MCRCEETGVTNFMKRREYEREYHKVAVTKVLFLRNQKYQIYVTDPWRNIDQIYSKYTSVVSNFFLWKCI